MEVVEVDIMRIVDVLGTGQGDGDEDDNEKNHAVHPDLHSARVKMALGIKL